MSLLQRRKQQFFNTMWPLCVKTGAATGVHPEIIFAQTALETGYGAHHPQNNYFGIKGNGQALTTTEFIDNRARSVVSSFAQFGDMGASVLGYTRFILNNKRYKAFRAPGSIATQLAALGRSGYATDPEYATKLARIVDELPALEKHARSIPGTLVRIVQSPIVIPAIPAQTSEKPMSDLSVFLKQHAGVLNVAANVISGLLEVAPIPAAAKTVASDVVSALQQHATNTATVAAGLAQPQPEPEQPSTGAAEPAPPETAQPATLASIEGTALDAALKEAEALLPQVIQDFAEATASGGLGNAIKELGPELAKDAVLVAQAGVDAAAGVVQPIAKSPTAN